MAKIPTTNIGMNLLQNEYGGSNPISMSEYYRSVDGNNGRLVDFSKPTAGGYITGTTNPTISNGGYAPGTNGTNGQNAGYRREAYVKRYPNLTSTDRTVFGADAGEPIGIPYQAGEPSPRMERIYYWNDSNVHEEFPLNTDTVNGPGTNRATGFLGSAPDTKYNYYTPNSYISGSNGQWTSGFGGCQNPIPSNVGGLIYPYTSVGPKTGVQYGPLTGAFGLYAMQSQVFYGIVRQLRYYTTPGTQLLNTTVPFSGTISLGDFKNQQN